MLDQIRAACRMANAIPFLNNGGCCVFAAQLGRKLLELGVPCWGVAFYDDALAWEAPTVKKARANVDNPMSVDEWADNGVEFDHVGIRFKYRGRYYQADSTGVTPVKSWLWKPYYRIVKGRFTIEQLESFAADGGYWNQAFPRRSGIPKIKRAIKEAFA